jgi:molybdopterin-containing oxidoreductase family iron-sulfur binding subunit
MEIKRRDFLKLIGATGVAVAAPGCTRKPPKSILPYVIPGDEIIPGKAVWYASVCRECPAGCGVHVRVREGRAVKVEGNPQHPVNGGRLCSRGQAALQGLYNPDRIQQPMRRTETGGWEKLTWEEAEAWLAQRLQEIAEDGRGNEIAWLTPHMTGSLDRLIDDWLAGFGSRRRLRYEPVGYEALRAGNRMAFGRQAIPSYDFSAARAILSFGADFLETWLSPVEYAAGFAEVRAVEGDDPASFVYFGPRRSLTAANADEWIAVQPEHLGAVALSLVHVIVSERLGVRLPSDEQRRIERLVSEASPENVARLTGLGVERLQAIAREFAAASPGLAVTGDVACETATGPATVAAVSLLNYVCGNIGRTVRFGPSHTLASANSYAEVVSFIRAMNAGSISALFISESNPVYSVPTKAGFEGALSKVPLVVACSSYFDETTARAHLVLPIHTPLESWGDHEPRRGVYGLMQPVMQPVFDTRLLGDLLLSLASRVGGKVAAKFTDATFYDYLRRRWQRLQRRLAPGADFDGFWYDALRRGGVWEEVPEPRVRLAPGLSPRNFRPLLTQARARDGKFRLLAYPSQHFYDGRGANRPWLQEVPDPITQVVWDNWVQIHPEDAARLKVRHGERVRLWSSQASVELPVYVDDGIQPGVVAVPAGQGHKDYGRYANGQGVNIYPLFLPQPVENSGGMGWADTEVQLNATGQSGRLVSVAGSDTQHDRELIQFIPLAELKRGVTEPKHEEIQMYPEHEHPDHQWGMVIDLNKCTGCSACVTACYAENNIAVVGKELVAHGREMAWIRIDRFYEEEGKKGRVNFLPMLCQQCDNAPCEPVCPVYAAYHTPEGLNAQVYNRCIGTRYCSNNCPYKARRFNWFAYEWPEPLNWQLNPDVTVRSKGIMEKCTFCVQRIVDGKNHAREEGRPVQDGDITPACAQACPSDAIVFGDLKDPRSKVSRLRQRSEPRGYRALEELNTQPAVIYLKKVTRDNEKVV